MSSTMLSSSQREKNAAKRKQMSRHLFGDVTFAHKDGSKVKTQHDNTHDSGLMTDE